MDPFPIDLITMQVRIEEIVGLSNFSKEIHHKIIHRITMPHSSATFVAPRNQPACKRRKLALLYTPGLLAAKLSKTNKGFVSISSLLTFQGSHLCQTSFKAFGCHMLSC